MGSSNASAVKAAIMELIKGLPEAAAENWDVDWGFSKSPERTWVYCGQISWDSSAWVTNLSREEVFNVDVVVNLKRRRGTVQEVEQDAMRIMGLIEAKFKADSQMSLGNVTMAELSPKRMDSWPSDEFTEAQFEAQITVTARF